MSHNAASVSSEPSPESVREQLARILASASFQTHPRAALFLTHVVEKTLTGRAGEIKQATIGCEVFGRPATYEPKQDAIVRSVARVLREKLNDYYLSAGAEDPVRIELPKGSYVPSFRRIREADEARGTPAVISPELAHSGRWRSISATALAACVLLAVWHYRAPLQSLAARPADAQTLYREGRLALQSGDFVRARPLLEAAAAVAPDAQIHADLSADLLALGKDALALDEAKKAEAATGNLSPTGELEVEAAFRMASGDSKAAIAAFAQLARWHPANAEYSRGLARAQLASSLPADCLRTLERSTDPQSAVVEAYCRAARGDYLGALEPVRRAASGARANGQRETYARARLLEAGLLMSTPHAEQAREARNDARKICLEIGDDSCVIRSLRQEANQSVWERRPASALTAYRSALETARRVASSEEIVALLDGEGVALMELDDYAGASEALVESMVTAQRLGRPVTGVRLDMVELALRQGQYARAVILADQTEKDAQTSGDHVTEAAARILKARALLLSGNLSGCESDLAHAREIIEKFHVTAGIPRTWRIAKANLSRTLGHLDEAARELETRADPGDPSADRDYSYRLARLQLLLDEGHYGQAQRLAKDTLSQLTGGGDQSAGIMVTALLSDAYGFSGRLEEAARTAASASAMLSGRTAPESRKVALVSAARWTGSALQSGI